MRTKAAKKSNSAPPALAKEAKTWLCLAWMAQIGKSRFSRQINWRKKVENFLRPRKLHKHTGTRFEWKESKNTQTATPNICGNQFVVHCVVHTWFFVAIFGNTEYESGYHNRVAKGNPIQSKQSFDALFIVAIRCVCAAVCRCGVGIVVTRAIMFRAAWRCLGLIV